MNSSNAPAIVKLEHVGFRYPSDARERWILRYVDLEICAGESIRLDGRNGSGKSTLLQLIADVFEPIEGCVTRRLGTSHIVYLNQDPSDFLADALTIQEQLLAGATNSAGATLSPGTPAFHLLSNFGVGIEKRPNAFAGELSGGQRQILALVCVILASPKLLILDEFTAYMDESSIQAACNLVSEFARKSLCSIIYVDQTKALPLRVTRVLLLLDGQLKVNEIPHKR